MPPSFAWCTCSIDLSPPTDHHRCTREELAAIPVAQCAAVYFFHEYTHFLQLITTVPGLDWLVKLIDFGVRGTLVTAGLLPDFDAPLSGEVEVLKLLAGLPDGAGRGRDHGARAGRLNLVTGVGGKRY